MMDFADKLDMMDDDRDVEGFAIPEDVLTMFLSENNAIEEVYDKRSFDDARKAWNYLIKQEAITTTVVLTTHKILMEHQSIENIEKGHYRKRKVWIGRREGMEWVRIPGAMENWIAGMNSDKCTKDCWKRSHVEYEEIHPFVDGNGRTGRMFMNWHRVKRGGERIYVVKEADRQKYYSWFH